MVHRNVIMKSGMVLLQLVLFGAHAYGMVGGCSPVYGGNISDTNVLLVV
jgi:hypothetical protein